jgi:hypothetical protein
MGSQVHGFRVLAFAGSRFSGSQAEGESRRATMISPEDAARLK